MTPPDDDPVGAPAQPAPTVSAPAQPAPLPAAPSYPWHATPEVAATRRQNGARIQGRRAGLVTRFLANAIDGGVALLVLGLGYAAVAIGQFVIAPKTFRFPAPSFALLLLLGGSILTVYFTVAWATTGRSYGDVVLGLRVVNFRGERMRWTGAAGRALLCVLVPIGLFWVLVSSQNRSLQDALLRTSVVYDWPAGP